jgi:Galactose oxidase, central domain
LFPGAKFSRLPCGDEAKGAEFTMKPSSKKFSLAGIALLAFLAAACSGLKSGSSSGGGGGGNSSGSFTIGGSISGLTGSGLVLQDNGVDNLTVTAAATKFTFATSVASGGAYKVTVLTQPSNPAQTCTVTSGTGTASANVTTVAVACTTNPVTATIGGTLGGLATGASVILENNGGDALTLTANGPFTFKTAVTGPTDAYAVTVLTQPTTPNQICTVASGSGTASANVTNVAVSCVLSYTIGGTVTGVTGSGLILQNSSDNEQLPISAATGNEAFTFKSLVPAGTSYTISIAQQPTNPNQTCVVTPGSASGVANANVTSVVVTCPAVTYSVGGTVVGLAGVPSSDGPITDGSFILQNVLGNTLVVPQNGPFQFATPEALNDQYQLSVFHGPSSQPQGCTLWNYKGVVTASITNIVVDCGHDDWTWIDGTNTAGIDVPVKPVYGAFPATPPTSIPNPFTNTPGARYGAAGWIDSYGSLFLFGGHGWQLGGGSNTSTLSGPLNDMWVCDMSFYDYCQWQLVGGYDPTAVTVNGNATTIGAQIVADAQIVGGGGYNPTPLARLGAATWTDASGNFWLFGGSDDNNFLCDLYMYNHSALAPAAPPTLSTYETKEGAWSSFGPTACNSVDQPGSYASAPVYPGSRTNAVTWVDASGNFWLFGGYGWDGQSPIATLGFLNDLWKFSPTGKTWTFVSGGNTSKANQNGIYGTQGAAAATNMPGGRQEAVGWADANGNLWLFGGEGLDSTGTANGILNDLWVYNIGTNQWTWVMGGNVANQTGQYSTTPFVGAPNTTNAAGTAGLPSGSSSTMPGSRWGAAAWADNNGDFWLFGGWGLDSTATNGNGALNDMWVYVPNSTPSQPGTWTWIKGSNTGSQNGQYGTITRGYLTSYQYIPGGRSNATVWHQNYVAPVNHFFNLEQFWLYGGEGYDATSTTGNGYLNDLWRYLPYQD